LNRLWRLLPRYCGLAVLLLGGVVLLGWVLGIALLTNGGIGSASMKVNTALCFVAAGGALMRRSGRKPDQPPDMWVIGGGLFILAFSLLTLAQYGLDVDIGIDQMLIRDTVTGIDPGRMAPATAAEFFAAASALLMPRVATDRFNASNLLWALVLVVAVAALVGYATNFDRLYQIGAYSSMALLTASGFTVLATGGLALSWPEVPIAKMLDKGAVANGLSSYVFAAIIVLFAFWLRYVLGKTADLAPPHATFYPAVVLIALLTSWRAALFAIMLSTLLANIYFIYPFGSFSLQTGTLVAHGLFILTSIVISILADQWRLLHQKAAVARDSLDELVSKRTKELIESSAQLATIFETAPIGLAILNRDLEFVLVNHRLAEINGLPPEAHLGKRPDQLLPDIDNLNKIFERLQHVIETGEPWLDVEITGITPAAPTIMRSWNESFFPICVEKDHIIGLGVVVTETTEKKRAEDALRDSEAQMRLALEGSNAGTWSWDVKSNTSSWDERYHRKYSSLPQESGSFEEWLTRVHPDDKGKLQTRLKTIMETPGDDSWQMEFRTQNLQIGERWILALGTALRDGNGRVIRMAGLNLDITERKQMEESLRASERRLTLASDAAKFGVYEFFTHERGVVLSPSLRRLLMIPADREVRSDELLNVVHPDDRERVALEVGKAVKQTGVYEFEYRLLRADGSVIWALDRGEAVGPLDKETGIVPLLRGTFIDITEIKRHEEHQRLLLDELNHRVKNSLVTIQSMASQTLRNSSTLEDAKNHLDARLLSLSKAHDVLTREKWETANLVDVVEQAIAPYSATDPMRFTVKGPNVRVPPRFALATAMALHELCTNAVKYGALSNDKGKVSFTWSISARNGATPSIKMQWNEKGGPMVMPPKRKGFGSRMIERGLAMDIHGKVTLKYAKSGVTCAITAPLLPNEGGGGKIPKMD
jgi:PAS domain S-box-containing protein